MKVRIIYAVPVERPIGFWAVTLPVRYHHATMYVWGPVVTGLVRYRATVNAGL